MARPPRTPVLDVLCHPATIATTAILVGWLGIWLIWTGARWGIVFPILTTVLAAVSMRRGQVIAERRRASLVEAVSAAEARNRELTLLRSLAGTMLAARTREELFREVAGVVTDLLTAEGSAFFLLVEEGRFLRVVAATGFMQRISGALLPVDHSLTGWIVNHNEAVISHDLATDSRTYRFPEIQDHLRDAAICPLRSAGVVIGALAAYNRIRPPLFSQADLDLLQTLADQAALGLDRVTVLEESRQNEQALAAKNRELEQATRLKSEFLANMSHELRTPLNAIIGFSDLLQSEDGGFTSEQREFIASISRNGKHLLGLINNVLDLSKIEAGRMTQTLGHVDLRVVVASTVSDTASLRAARRQRCTVDLDDASLAIVGDGQRIRQVLLNLLANASKFTPEGGEISVRVVLTQVPLPIPSQRAGDRPRLVNRQAVWVAVTDTGIGIKPEDQKRLFVAFSQVDSSASRRAQGTGLGLALCQQFVEMHGGTIGVESIEGKGSTFWFLLPVAGPVRRGSLPVDAADETV